MFVALDEGPDHQVFPGVGFITIPELSWRRVEAASDAVQVGQCVTCKFLEFDTWNAEARLSLCATRPDPFSPTTLRWAQKTRGRVTKLVPSGAFLEASDGTEGLVHLRELVWTPVRAPEDVVQVGDEATVVVTEVDRERRGLALSRRQAASLTADSPHRERTRFRSDKGGLQHGEPMRPQH